MYSWFSSEFIEVPSLSLIILSVKTLVKCDDELKHIFIAECRITFEKPNCWNVIPNRIIISCYNRKQSENFMLAKPGILP